MPRPRWRVWYCRRISSGFLTMARWSSLLFHQHSWNWFAKLLSRVFTLNMNVSGALMVSKPSQTHFMENLNKNYQHRVSKNDEPDVFYCNLRKMLNLFQHLYSFYKSRHYFKSTNSSSTSVLCSALSLNNPSTTCNKI